MLASGDDDLKLQAKIMLFTIWLVWFLQQFIILICLLNFLIAIVSQSYENVMSKKEQFKYRERVLMNKECLTVLQYFIVLSNFNTILIVSQIDEDSQASDEWQGYL